jgi:hypothetical protein
LEALRQRVIALINQGRWDSLYQAIHLLISETGRERTLDPFENADLLPWNDAGGQLIQRSMYLEALTLFQNFLDCCYNLQVQHNRRIHKGTPLQYLGMVNRLLGQFEQARRYHILAFIEDVIRTENLPQEGVVESPSSIVLITTYRMREAELISLQRFTHEKLQSNPQIFYPEKVLLEWTTSVEKSGEMLVARSKEEMLYKVNLPYLQSLHKEALKDTTGELFEELAYYLFSCVSGFEPIHRKMTKAYHLDVVIRNLIKDHPLLESLGDYIGVECKNLSTTVSVEQLDHFIHKLRMHDMKCGIIFTNKGISGIKYNDDVCGRLIQIKTFNRDGLVIFDITKSDLKKISKGENLLTLLIKKYEDIRFS